jgi:hypothetical protein
MKNSQLASVLVRRKGRAWLRSLERIETTRPRASVINYPRKRLLWPSVEGPPPRYPAIERHHVYMAHMLAAHGIDVDSLTSHQLQSLVLASHVCAHCSNRERCRTWQEWGRANAKPHTFCPNATLFEKFAAAEAADRTSRVAARPFVLEQAARTLANAPAG